jgi:CO dehydrogenase maturation factor
MGEKIVVTGRGGSGKSTFAALVARCLGEMGYGHLLVVDSDPDGSLGEMLGVQSKMAGKRTISEILYDILERRLFAKLVGATASEKLEPLLFEDALYEGEGYFDFIAVGVKWSEGCYCIPDRALSEVMERWSENYDYVIIDSPAGIEHLNRRITREMRDVFNILDPSKKSFDNALRSYRLMKELDINFENYYLVGGYRFPKELEAEAETQPFPYLGRVEFDEQVYRLNLEGKPLLELPEDSPAYASIRAILRRAGYGAKPPSLSELLGVEEGG